MAAQQQIRVCVCAFQYVLPRGVGRLPSTKTWTMFMVYGVNLLYHENWFMDIYIYVDIWYYIKRWLEDDLACWEFDGTFLLEQWRLF